MTVMTEMANGLYDEPEPDFNDPENYVDAISDQELLADLLKQKPQKYDGLSASVVIDGLPQVGPEKLDKLKGIIHKLISKYGNPVNIEYPLDENGSNKEYMFVEFEKRHPGDDNRQSIRKRTSSRQAT